MATSMIIYDSLSTRSRHWWTAELILTLKIVPPSTNDMSLKTVGAKIPGIELEPIAAMWISSKSVLFWSNTTKSPLFAFPAPMLTLRLYPSGNSFRTPWSQLITGESSKQPPLFLQAAGYFSSGHRRHISELVRFYQPYARYSALLTASSGANADRIDELIEPIETPERTS